MTKAIDETGNVYGRLTVMKRAENYVSPGGKQAAQWKCECECGELSVATGSSLRSGRTRSCGCLAADKVRSISTTHGATTDYDKTPEYRAWLGAKKRCLNTNEEKYPDYGGRGITVCDQWIESFGAFLRDMGERPSARHSLDRIDNDGDYTPENCRWATRQEQARNKRNNRAISAFGREMTTVEWAEEVGIDAQVIRQRLDRGWAPERAVSPIPKTPRQEAVEAGHVRYSTGEPCKRGHHADRYTNNGTCVECHYQRKRQSG